MRVRASNRSTCPVQRCVTLQVGCGREFRLITTIGPFAGSGGIHVVPSQVWKSGGAHV